jgi:hypothetical protein
MKLQRNRELQPRNKVRRLGGGACPDEASAKSGTPAPQIIKLFFIRFRIIFLSRKVTPATPAKEWRESGLVLALALQT